jgi:KDO2-lipid IV(A) lauroyltransferase
MPEQDRPAAPKKRAHPLRKITGIISIGIAEFFGLLPLPASRALARFIARAVYHVFPAIRKSCLNNLKLAYGDELTDADRNRILIEMMESIATVAAEFTRTKKLRGDFLNAHVTIEGKEHLTKDKGTIIIGAHMGNWEWLAPSMGALDWKTAEIIRALDDPKFDRYVEDIRRCNGTDLIPKHNASKQVLRRLKEGYLVGILADQSQRHNAVPSTFFGQPCWTTIGPVMLAKRAGAPIHSVAMLRKPDGEYILKFSPEIPMIDTGDHLGDLVENTQRCQDALEKLVREYPGQWLWFHKRWKKRPDLEKEWEARLAAAKQSLPDSVQEDE